MKNLIILAALAFSMTAAAQSVEKKLVINESTKVINLDATEGSKQTYKPSGYTANYKGKSYLVYESSKGKLFIFMISKKSGKEYRKYLN